MEKTMPHECVMQLLRARGWRRRVLSIVAAGAMAFGTASSYAISLADKPLFSTISVPGNLLLALSVEWPTAATPAYPSTVSYSTATAYVGYFDSEKCYRYVYNSTTPANSYFTPDSMATGRSCTSTSTVALWSGNYLNWASTQTLDAFRFTLTGGYRAVDTIGTTIIEKTRHSGQGSHTSIYPDKVISTGTASATPFGWSTVKTQIWALGVQMYVFPSSNTLNCNFSTASDNKTTFSCAGTYSGSCTTAAGAGAVSCSPTGALSCTRTVVGSTYSYTCDTTLAPRQTCAGTGASRSATPSCSSASSTIVDYNGQSTASSTDLARTYRMYVRVRACDPVVGLEANCVQYGSDYKPEGLMQQYSNTLRYSAFGYLNDSTATRDGGVMRARMKSIGPTKPVPGSAPIANPAAEWDAVTGIMLTNPDSADSASTATSLGLAATDIPNSGAMNYLNRFGWGGGNYKSLDPASELYYSGLRYFKNQGNVPAYTDMSSATSANKKVFTDGFPVITSWDDPIQYTCQKNFILGIGDVNTHYDTNLPGTTLNSSPAVEPSTMPTEVSSDTTVNVTTATNMVGQLEGISGLGTTRTGSSSHASYFIAGLAYDAHTNDIRSDVSGEQRVSTYWLDVMEGQVYKSKNQYYLAAKYGGFEVPVGFSAYAGTNGPTTLNDSMWWTSGDMTPTVANKRPDNYFLANQADKMKAGLQAAFARIASEASVATGTAFSTPTARVQTTGSSSYSSNYDPKNWTGMVIGRSTSYNPITGMPSFTHVWDAQALLDTSTPSARKIVTCCTASGAGLAFQASVLSSTALHTRTNYASFANVPGVSSQSAADFVAYLRGDRTKELSGGGVYRSRVHLLGDIVNSKLNPVGPPTSPYRDATNPGYTAFARAQRDRETVVYVGSNDGMLHAFGGDTTIGTTTGGVEKFAYIPSFVYGDNTNASTTGLAALGNPNFVHHYMVDGSPHAFDLDMKNTLGSPATTNEWRTILVGGLGKGGNGYYALDITDPSSWTSESEIAGKVLWEFTDARMGRTYGDPSVVKTAKYGWVVIFTSGYNNSDGKGYFFIVNPRTGVLLEAVATPEGSTSAPLDMGQHSAFVNDFGDFTADAVYAGDMQGNLWRLDLTSTIGSYAAPVKIARLTTSAGAGQPVTTRPLIEIDPGTNKRYVLIGTGRLLDDSDISSQQTQTFYSILDGTKSAFFTASTLPSGALFPVDRSQLNANTALVTGIGTAPVNPMGWYVDLGADSTTGIAERVNITPTVNVGIVAVAINIPNGQPCTPQGSSRALAVTFSDGKSVLQDDSGAFIDFTSSSAGLATDVAFTKVGGKPRLIVGDSRGNVVSVKGKFTGAGSLKRLNWREVPTAD